MVRRFLLLNGLATLGVVLNHASAWGFIAMFWWPQQYLSVTAPNFDQLGSPAYFALRGVEQLIIFSIAAFLFVSGFFVAFATGRNQATVSWKVVRTRILYLVVPYLLWSVILFAFDGLQGVTQSAGEYSRRLLTGQATAAYYFVPLLCQLYLLSPIVVRLAKTRWKLLLVVSAGVQLAVQTLIYLDMLGILQPAMQPLMVLTESWLFPGHLFWFAGGVVAGFHLKTLEQWLLRVRWGLLAAVIILLPLGVLEWEAILRFSGQEWLAPRETILDNLYAGAFILAFLAFHRASIPLAKELGDLGGKSFGIYLVHSPVLEVTARAIYHLVPWLLAYQFLFQPVLIAVGLAFPLGLMAVARWRRSPAQAYYQYIFG